MPPSSATPLILFFYMWLLFWRQLLLPLEVFEQAKEVHTSPQKFIVCSMKVCVYAIAKNEEKFVRRWLDSMREADGIYVLDTGSDDGTVRLLKEGGAHVKTEIFSPFRFDLARNASLQAVPEDADLCVCTDLDEVFAPGWRKGLEEAAKAGAEQIYYRYTWNFNPDGSEGHVFWTGKAHTRFGFEWRHPVHEVLYTTDGHESKVAYAKGVWLKHLADPTKSRAQYLPLLELSVREHPENDRNAHYLGREYFFHGRYDDAIAELKRHLSLPSSVWKDERAASMRYLSRCYLIKGDMREGEKWILRAVAEAEYLREPWVDAAQFYVRTKRWHGAAFCALRALEITKRSMSYINEPAAWGYAPYDCLAVAQYYLGDLENSLKNARIAADLNKDDPRLTANLSLIRAAYAAKKE